MIRKIFILICILYSNILIACIVPEYGPEYDGLISIEQNEQKNSFHLKMPKRIKNSGSAKIYLAYMKKTNIESELKGAEHMKRLYFWFDWKNISSDIVVKDKDGYLPYIFVTWPRNGCDVTATSEFIERV